MPRELLPDVAYIRLPLPSVRLNAEVRASGESGVYAECRRDMRETRFCSRRDDLL